MKRVVTAFACLVFTTVPASGQEVEYQSPFPGGYPSMYIFPPPVTASPTYPAWSPDGGSLAFAYQGRIWLVPVRLSALIDTKVTG